MPRIILFVVIIFGLFSFRAWSTIIIQKGAYEVPVMVVATKKGPVAVFNLRSYSECRVLLTGGVASKIKIKDADGFLIKIMVNKVIDSSSGEAELIEYSLLKKNQEIPFVVGNNLKPIKH